MKLAFTLYSDEALRKVYPFADLLEGWYFRYKEISNGAYFVEGSTYGETLSRELVLTLN